MSELTLTNVVKDFDIFKLPDNADYSVNRDVEGNLWFARSVRSPKNEGLIIGAEVYKFDGDTATQFLIKGDAPEINFLYRMATDASGTAWLFQQFDTAPPERPLFGIDRNGKWVSKGSQLWKDRVLVKGKPCVIRTTDGESFTLADEHTGRKVAGFKAGRSYSKVVTTAEHIITFNSYMLQVWSTSGRLLHELTWDKLRETDEQIASEVFDFETPAQINSRSLLVPMCKRQGGAGVLLYVLDLEDFSFRPSPLMGALRKKPTTCLFDRKGRLWAAHHHSPAYGYPTTSFSVVATDRSLTTIGGKQKQDKARSMSTAKKRKAALAALDNHARRYKVTIPDRLRTFYVADFDRHDLRCVTTKVLSWGKGTFQLALTPPTWLDKDDDAVNGPGGDWDGAKHHVPIFVTGDGLYVVVNLENPECPTGWYHEEECARSGPAKGASSLDAFLASLAKPPAEAADEDEDEVTRPADPEQEDHWKQDFSDDSPRVFDAIHDEDD